jgi:D-alanyl-D-alanine carboxypeptidase
MEQGPTDVGTIRRVPVQGLTQGNQDTVRGGASAELTDESAAGRAITLIPSGFNPASPFVVLLHLHGYTNYWTDKKGKKHLRPYAGWRERKGGNQVRDVAHDQLAQQIEAGGDAQVVGVLPQGGEESQFGADYGLRADDYIKEVLTRVSAQGELTVPPVKAVEPKDWAKWSVVLSAHSGGGHTVRRMLEADLHQRTGTDPVTGKPVTAEQRRRDASAPLPSALGEIALFDAINNASELTVVTAWVTNRLDEILAAPDKEKKLAETPKFRAYYASYVDTHTKLRKAIVDWFTTHRAGLGPFAERAWALFQVIPVTDAKGRLVEHEEIVRGHRLSEKSAPVAGSVTDALTSRRTPAVAESLDKALAEAAATPRGKKAKATAPAPAPKGAGSGGRRTSREKKRATPHTLPSGAITSARLGKFGSTDETAFRRRVYDRQVAHALESKEYSFGLPDDDEHIGHVDGQPISKVAETDAVALLAAATTDLATEKGKKIPKAVACRSIGVGNAYRSPERDFNAWQNAFAGYFADTAKQRAALTEGPLGKQAEDIILKLLIRFKAAPGFSNHTAGLAIDFKTVQGGVALTTSHKQDTLWEASWLYGWLQKHGGTHHFTQLPSEKWHWDHTAAPAGGQADAQSGAHDAGEAPTGGQTTSDKPGAHDQKTTGSPPPPAPAGTATITFGPHAHADKIAASSLDVLRDVLAAAGLGHAMISSTARTAADQARAMYQNLAGRGRGKGVAAQHRLYGPAGDQVIDVYAALRAEGRKAGEIQAAMRDKILEIGPSKVSRHCGDPAMLNVFDVAPSSIGSDEQQAAFVAAAQAEVGKRVSRFIPFPGDPGHHFEIRPH